jgi:hypothetical protein
MRLALALVVLAGCIQETYSDPPTSGGGWGTGPGGTGGHTSFGCHVDSDCGADVCARNGSCVTPDSVKTVHVSWTMNGQPASEQTCAFAPHLDISFYASSTGDEFGFSPVPCAEGKFTVDKLPVWYVTVQLSRTGDQGTGGATTDFAADNTASVDLVY